MLPDRCGPRSILRPGSTNTAPSPLVPDAVLKVEARTGLGAGHQVAPGPPGKEASPLFRHNRALAFRARLSATVSSLSTDCRFDQSQPRPLVPKTAAPNAVPAVSDTGSLPLIPWTGLTLTQPRLFRSFDFQNGNSGPGKERILSQRRGLGWSFWKTDLIETTGWPIACTAYASGEEGSRLQRVALASAKARRCAPPQASTDASFLPSGRAAAKRSSIFPGRPTDALGSFRWPFIGTLGRDAAHRANPAGGRAANVEGCDGATVEIADSARFRTPRA